MALFTFLVVLWWSNELTANEQDAGPGNPVPGAAYQPGIDVRGRPVAPADVNPDQPQLLAIPEGVILPGDLFGLSEDTALEVELFEFELEE
ncbi:MAG: hypothetical protein ACFB6S_15315 [Geminicoccaceae bacterium]